MTFLVWLGTNHLERESTHLKRVVRQVDRVPELLGYFLPSEVRKARKSLGNEIAKVKSEVGRMQLVNALPQYAVSRRV